MSYLQGLCMLLFSSRYLSRFTSSIILSIIYAFLSGCSTNPATGRQEFTPFLPASQEKQIGAEQHRSIVNEFGGIYENPQLTSYVDRISKKIAAASELPADYYHVFILNTPQVNAFALPGGYVYLTRGLIAVANTEAELAGVIGHEMGHVTARHAANRSTIQGITGIGAMLVGALTGSQQLGQVAQFGSQWYAASYSRDQEYEADMLGVRYLAKADYNPHGQADFLRSLRIYDSYQKKANNQQDSGPSFFSTHPDTTSRVQKARDLAVKANNNNGTTGRNTHITAIKDMTWGDDPKQGIVRGNSFVHPDLKFSFSTPSGYRIINRPEAVYIQGNNNILIKFDADTQASGRSSQEYIQHEFAQGASISTIDSVSSQSFKGVTALSSVTNNGRRLSARLFAFRVSPTKYYRFLMAAPENVFNAKQSEFYKIARSLKKLSTQEANSIRPYSIGIKSLQPSDTADKLAARYIPDFNYKTELFRALNGFDNNEKLPSKGYIKIIKK